MKSAVEPNVTGTLPPEDVVSIRKLSRSFTDAWLGEDADRIPDQIMELLLPTAVIVPPPWRRTEGRSGRDPRLLVAGGRATEPGDDLHDHSA